MLSTKCLIACKGNKIDNSFVWTNLYETEQFRKIMVLSIRHLLLIFIIIVPIDALSESIKVKGKGELKFLFLVNNDESHDSIVDVINKRIIYPPAEMGYKIERLPFDIKTPRYKTALERIKKSISYETVFIIVTHGSNTSAGKLVKTVQEDLGLFFPTKTILLSCKATNKYAKSLPLLISPIYEQNGGDLTQSFISTNCNIVLDGKGDISLSSRCGVNSGDAPAWTIHTYTQTGWTEQEIVKEHKQVLREWMDPIVNEMGIILNQYNNNNVILDFKAISEFIIYEKKEIMNVTHPQC